MDRPGRRRTAAPRARSLAELAQAVDQAQRLAWSLRASEASSTEAKQLYDRLEAVRTEVEAMRRGHRSIPRRDIDPMWTSLLTWSGGRDD